MTLFVSPKGSNQWSAIEENQKEYYNKSQYDFKIEDRPLFLDPDSLKTDKIAEKDSVLITYSKKLKKGCK